MATCGERTDESKMTIGIIVYHDNRLPKTSSFFFLVIVCSSSMLNHLSFFRRVSLENKICKLELMINEVYCQIKSIINTFKIYANVALSKTLKVFNV